MTATTFEHITPRDDLPLARFLPRQWPIVLCMVSLLGAAGAVFGATRDLTYKAEARLIVGPSAASAQATTATFDNSATLATTYAQLGAGAQTRRDADRTLNRPLDAPPLDVSFGRVSSNPVVLVTASAASPEGAVPIANAYAGALRGIVSRQISEQRRTDDQLDVYEKATQSVIEARVTLRRLRQRFDDGVGSVTQGDVDKAQTKLNSAELRQQTAGEIYARAQQESQALTGLTRLDAGRSVGSNGASLVLRWLAIGAGAGALAGGLLALGFAARSRRRVRRHSA